MFRIFTVGHQRPPYGRPYGGSMGSGLLLSGILCVLFGLAIIADPALLAYIVATFFIVTGVSLLTAWWKLRR